MGGLFRSPKAPNISAATSAADKAREKAEQDRDRLKAKNEATIRNRRNRSRGRSLLAFTETGLQGVPGRKTKLGQ